MTILNDDDLPPKQASYEVVRTITDDKDYEGGFRWLKLVKLSKSYIVRNFDNPNIYAECQYALVGVSNFKKTDDYGTFDIRETVVLASDAEGETHKAYLYYSQAVLTLEEAMFLIGEV